MTAIPSGQFRPTPNHRAVRRKALLRVTVVLADGSPRPAMVRNIGTNGMSVALQGQPPAVDDVVEVLLPQGISVWGIVRWVRGTLAGIELDPASRTQVEAAGVLAGMTPALPG